MLQRPSRERISSPPCHSLSTTREQQETATQRTWLREELRIAVQESGLLAEEDNGVIERSGAPAHIIVSSQTFWSACTEMASPAAGQDVPKPPPRTDSERAEPSHPEPACQEAQKWIEVSDEQGLWVRGFCNESHRDINTQPSPVRCHLLWGLCSVGLRCGTTALRPA